MATYLLAPDPCNSTFFVPGTNTPGNGVQVFTYLAGTSTKVSVAKDIAGSSLHTNPIVLDSGGNLPSASSMYIEQGVTIDVVYAPSNDSDPPASPYRTVEDVSGIPEALTSTAQWIDSGFTPTFIGATSFRVSGDQTGELQVGRRLKTGNTGGTIYSRITSSVFGTSTSVGVINDSGSLDAGLSTVAYGILSASNPSVPLLTDFYPMLRSSTNSAGILNFGIQGWSSTGAVNWQATTAATVAYTGDLAFGNLTTTNARLLYPPKHIEGLTLANAGVDTVSTLPGSTVNSSATHNLILSAFLVKDPTTTWTASTGGGGLLDAGVVSTNIWYWAHLIKNSTGTWVDVGYSTSFSAPSLPSGYNVSGYIPIGAIRREAASTRLFTMIETAGGGIRSLWSDPPLDLDQNNLGAAMTTVALSGVPTGTAILANLNVMARTNSSEIMLYVKSPSASDEAPSYAAGPLLTIGNAAAGAAAVTSAANISVQTNSSAQVTLRGHPSAAAGASTVARIATLGWEWGRR